MVKVKFKSDPHFYIKEKSGIKNNTVRIYEKFSEVDEKDERFATLKQMYKKQLENENKLPDDEELYIEIVKASSGESFIRKIRDITIFENNFEMIFIITWEHKEV